MIQFKKAVKTESKLRLAIAGPSGSGKTYTSLAIGSVIATHEGKRVAFVDTEHGSASKYADIFDFDVIDMHAPFHPDKYVESIKAAASAGYGVIILDSMSHAWNGEGGLLQIVDDIAKRMKTTNTYAAWKDATPIQTRMIESMLAADIHIISTVRSKQDYAMEKDERTGRTAIRKVGMAPVQRDGFEYEFDVFIDMDIDNNGIVTKSRCPALSGNVYSKPGKDVAGILIEWLHGAPEPNTPTRNRNGTPTAQPDIDMADVPELDPGNVEPSVEWTEASADGMQPAQTASDGDSDAPVQAMKANTRKKLHAVGTQVYGDGWEAERHRVIKAAGLESSNDLTEEQANKWIAKMNASADGEKVAA